MKKMLLIGLLNVGMSLFFPYVNGCTDFTLRTKDEAVINGRSMEFALDLKSKVMMRPKGQVRQSEPLKNFQALTWTSKYASIFVNGLEMDHVIDGFNEKGLSVGILWQPDSEYPQVDPDKSKAALNLISIGDYLLDNFATVDEVKEGIKGLTVVAAKVDAMNMIPPIHVSLHDASGKSGVIEFIEGKMNFLENPAGVLTNAPRLDWHLTNLRNYLDVSAKTTGDVKVGSTILAPVGQGNGLLGVPGDWSPPSRFVKIAIVKHFVLRPENPSQGVNLAQHLLNLVDIPLGAIQEQDGKFENTQWVVIKDLKNQTFHYRTYADLNLKSIDFKKEMPREGSETVWKAME